MQLHFGEQNRSLLFRFENEKIPVSKEGNCSASHTLCRKRISFPTRMGGSVQAWLKDSLELQNFGRFGNHRFINTHIWTFNRNRNILQRKLQRK